jgi:hypothetical protein
MVMMMTTMHLLCTFQRTLVSTLIHLTTLEEDVRGLTIPSENEHLLCLTLIIETIMVFAS